MIAALIIIIRNGDYIGNFIIDTIDNKDLLSINKNIEFTNTVFIPEEIINNNSSLTHERYVDYNSALYIDGELVIRDKIIANFDKMLNNLKNGNNIDIIELQTEINDLRESLEENQKNNVDTKYMEYKNNGYTYMKSTLDILDKYLANNTLEYQNIFSLYQNYSEYGNKHFDELKNIFDENGVEYTLDEKEDGTRIIHFKCSY